MTRLAVTADNVQDFYDDRYLHGYMERHDALEQRRVRDTLQAVPVLPKAILDYGCGQGSWAQTLSEAFPNARIVGIDVSGTAISKASEKFPAHTFSVFDGTSAPFDDETFDLVFSYHVLEHVQCLDEVISDMSRLLKREGCLCLIFPCGNPGSLEEKITRLVAGGKEMSADGQTRFFYEDSGHIRRLKSSETISLLSRKGIQIHREFYSCQRWGAILWIGSSSAAFIAELFDHRRGVDESARAGLSVLKAVFRLVSVAARVHRVDIKQRIKDAGSAKARLAWFGLWPAKIAVAPLILTLRLAAFLEWRFNKSKKNGSGQFLLFLKPV